MVASYIKRRRRKAAAEAQADTEPAQQPVAKATPKKATSAPVSRFKKVWKPKTSK